MALFRKHKRKRLADRPYVGVPAEVASIEEVVSQGMMIAEVAVRMATKNFIIINAMGDQSAYNEEVVMETVRDELEALAIEKHADALRIAEVRIQREGSVSQWVRHQNHAAEEMSQLARRQQSYQMLAEELERLYDDDDYVRETAEKARQDAWREVSRSFEIMLTTEKTRLVRDAEYWKKRDARIKYLIEKDLAKLAKRQGRRSTPE
ncbi:asparagine synthase [Lysinibacter sp. HNR]|uniref:asparagine synthase n=1 Tax=Lysinibacter sp. HNR TaxID=3031408 RepID=UPI0024356690|nr:asparagine synthase [Lysinibacter sp. HNR]WGD36523.1 asparagine synthase [Lysinibacter sp. HNR]